MPVKLAAESFNLSNQECNFQIISSQDFFACHCWLMISWSPAWAWWPRKYYGKLLVRDCVVFQCFLFPLCYYAGILHLKLIAMGCPYSALYCHKPHIDIKSMSPADFVMTSIYAYPHLRVCIGAYASLQHMYNACIYADVLMTSIYAYPHLRVSTSTRMYRGLRVSTAYVQCAYLRVVNEKRNNVFWSLSHRCEYGQTLATNWLYSR